jgi:hypothetical protein
MRLLFILIVLLSLAATGLIPANAEVNAEQNLLIFYSNDVMGETEPCG